MLYILMHFFFKLYGDHRDLHVLTHSFPTRRSSDLKPVKGKAAEDGAEDEADAKAKGKKAKADGEDEPEGAGGQGSGEEEDEDEEEENSISLAAMEAALLPQVLDTLDRKSTRLNSSH